jgi:hypothetical protein
VCCDAELAMELVGLAVASKVSSELVGLVVALKVSSVCFKGMVRRWNFDDLGVDGRDLDGW